MINHLLTQYFAIKEKYTDALLFFRVGDFYETYNKDAEILSHRFGLTLGLTTKDPAIKASVSIPHYTRDTALHALVKAGYKVAVGDGLEATKAGPMKRDVTGLFPE